jgi:hypothetical protein
MILVLYCLTEKLTPGSDNNKLENNIPHCRNSSKIQLQNRRKRQNLPFDLKKYPRGLMPLES